MKKFRVGEYVKWGEEVARVTHVYEEPSQVWITMMTEKNGTTTVPAEALTKLNIHFKHFKIVLKSDGIREVWDSMRKIRGFGRVHLVCMEEQHDIFIGYKIPHKRIMSTYVQTIEQAEAWLSLQHARTLVESKEATK